MGFELKILGSGSALPAFGRNHTSQLLYASQTHFLIDCGEATQHQFQKYQIKTGKLEHIFISHLHGDHYLGLMGLLSSLHLQGRTKPMHVYGPRPLAEILWLQLKHSQTILNYPLEFHATNPEGINLVFENEELTVHTFPLTHRIPTTGFLFREKPKPRNIIKGSLPYGVSHQEIQQLKSGQNVLDAEGRVKYHIDAFTTPSPPSVSYAYCSDTLYQESLADFLQNVDFLFHEATFTDELAKRAATTFHTTASQAAKLAALAHVGQLLIGHFSSRYNDLSAFLNEASAIFPKTKLALEGHTFHLHP